MTITKSIKIDENLSGQLIDLYRLIRSSKGVAVSGHVNPDGDNLGSQLALIEFLESSGIPCWSINEERVPDILKFLPHSEKIRSVADMKDETFEFDTLIVVDSGDFKRIGEAARFVDKNTRIVNIDHHQANDGFGDVNIVDTHASSIGELLYYFFRLNEVPITRTMAANLYVSIVTDTGSFKYDQMRPAVHIIAADLMELGVVPYEFTPMLYQNKSAGYVKLVSILLGGIVYENANRIAISALRYEDMENTHCFDTEGLIDFLSMIDTVEVAVLIKEKEKDNYSVSLRSKRIVNVSDVSSEFGGGGHARAAGFRASDVTVKELTEKIVRTVNKELKL